MSVVQGHFQGVVVAAVAIVMVDVHHLPLKMYWWRFQVSSCKCMLVYVHRMFLSFHFHFWLIHFYIYSYIFILIYMYIYIYTFSLPSLPQWYTGKRRWTIPYISMCVWTETVVRCQILVPKQVWGVFVDCANGWTAPNFIPHPFYFFIYYFSHVPNESENLHSA